MQLFHWVCYETGAFLSLLVCIANVSSGKGTLLYVCVYVCVCVRVRVRARFHWQSMYFDQWSLEPCYNTMVVTQFKICLQFDFIWWGFAPCRRVHRHFECCSREEEEAGIAYCLIKVFMSREILMLHIQNSFCCVYFIHLSAVELDGLPRVDFRVHCHLTSCEIKMNLVAQVQAFLPVSSDDPY